MVNQLGFVPQPNLQERRSHYKSGDRTILELVRPRVLSRSIFWNSFHPLRAAIALKSSVGWVDERHKTQAKRAAIALINGRTIHLLIIFLSGFRFHEASPVSLLENPSSHDSLDGLNRLERRDLNSCVYGLCSIS